MRGAVSGLAQPLDEGRGFQGQRDAVVAHAVQRRHAAGEEARPVRHADGRGDVEPLGGEAFGREPVDRRRAHDLVTVAAEMVGTELIGDEDEEIGPVRPRAMPCGKR